MKNDTGLNHTYLKNKNSGHVLGLVAANNGISRIDISRQMGLTKMAITNTVSQLIADGQLMENGCDSNSNVGRNPISLGIAPTAGKAAALHIGRNDITAMLVDMRAQILYRTQLPLIKETADSLTKKIFSALDSVFDFKKGNYASSAMLGIGISSIGPLDSSTCELINPRDFFGIKNYPIGKLINERYGYRVFMNNDMNASALAESIYGKHHECSDFIYMGITNGIGLGIISEGSLFQKSNSFAGEIGHMSIQFDGPLCNCGNRGCLEAFASWPLIREKVRGAMGCSIPDEAYPTLGDEPLCTKIFTDIVEKLSVALINAVNMLNPQCIILGGYGALIPKKYVDMLEKKVNEGILVAGYRNVPVYTSSFGTDSALIGSACCVFSELFEGNIQIDDTSEQ